MLKIGKVRIDWMEVDMSVKYPMKQDTNGNVIDGDGEVICSVWSRGKSEEDIKFAGELIARALNKLNDSIVTVREDTVTSPVVQADLGPKPVVETKDGNSDPLEKISPGDIIMQKGKNRKLIALLCNEDGVVLNDKSSDASSVSGNGPFNFPVRIKAVMGKTDAAKLMKIEKRHLKVIKKMEEKYAEA